LFAREIPGAVLPNLHFEVMDARELRFDRLFGVVFSTQRCVGGRSPRVPARSGGRLRHGGRLMVSCGGKGNAQSVFAALRAEMRLKRGDHFRLERHTFLWAGRV
jgi:hypothetical protein